jgi:hypothetical protein
VAETPRRSPVAYLRHLRLIIYDRSMGFLLLVLTLLVFVVTPLVQAGRLSPLPMDVAFGLLIMAAAAMAMEGRWLARAVVLSVLAALGFRAVAFARPEPFWQGLDAALLLLAFTLLAQHLIVQVFRNGRVNLYRVQGAVAVYLLLGMIFNQAFLLLALQNPAAFTLNGTVVPLAVLRPELGWFSFAMLTTMGNDVAAVHPYARSLAAFEAVIGQLFPAILIARLVAMELAWRTTREEAASEARREEAEPAEPTKRKPTFP